MPDQRADKPARRDDRTRVPVAGGRPARRGHRFTLLELMLAMAVTVVIGLLAYKFFSNMQNVWHASVSATNAHEDARLALDLMAADLQAAVAAASDAPGEDILIHQPDAHAIWLVAVAPDDASSGCALVEVAYRLEGQTLQRATVDASCASWSIYGNRTDATDQDGYRDVIDNVIAMRIACYDDSFGAVVPEQTTTLPAVFTVSLTVLDRRYRRQWQQLPEVERAAFEARFARTFWKTVRPE